MHRPSYHKWSKLSALPLIGVNPEMYSEASMEQEHIYSNIDVSFNEANQQEVAGQLQIIDQDSSPVDDSEQGMSTSKHVNFGNVTIGTSLIPEQKPLHKMSKLNSCIPSTGMALVGKHADISKKCQPNNGKVSVNSDSLKVIPSPETTGVAHATCVGHTSSVGKEQFSTVTIDCSQIDQQWKLNSSRNLRGIEKRMSDLQNAVLINSWIKILENTKDSSMSRGAAFADGMSPQVLSTSQTVPMAGYSPIASAYHKKMANINLATFFNKPVSVVREYNRKKHRSVRKVPEDSYNDKCYGGLSIPPATVSEQVTCTGNSHPKTEKRPPQAVQQVYTADSVTSQRNPRNTSYARCLPTIDMDKNGLMDLLGVHRLETKYGTGTEHDEDAFESRGPNIIRQPQDNTTGYPAHYQPNKHVPLKNAPVNQHPFQVQTLKTGFHSEHQGMRPGKTVVDNKRRLHIKVDITPQLRAVENPVHLIRPLPLSRPGMTAESGNDSESVHKTVAFSNDQNFLGFPASVCDSGMQRRGMKQKKLHKVVRQHPVDAFFESRVVVENAYSGLAVVGSAI